MSEATLKKLGAGMGEDPEGVCSPISKEFRIVLILGMAESSGSYQNVNSDSAGLG